MNRVDKIYRYHRDNGLWWTLIWIAEHFARRRLFGAGTSTPHESLATHWVDATAGATASGATLELAPGSAAIQDLGLPFHTILSVRVLMDRASDHDLGNIALLDGGIEIHSGTIRARAATQALKLPETGVRAQHGRISLRVAHAGRRGVMRVRLDASGQSGLKPARLSGAAEALELPLAVRVGGRAPNEIAHYPRALHLARATAGGTFWLAGVDAPLPGVSGLPATPESLFAACGEGILILGRGIGLESARDLVGAAQARLVPVLGVTDAGKGGSLPLAQLERWSDAATAAANLPAAIEAALAAQRQRVLPKVSVVTVFASDSAWSPAVLESYRRQAYDGELEFVFVDNGSTDGSAAAVSAWAASNACRVERLPSPQRAGAALNRGIACASGDVIIVMDGRHAMGGDFVRAHAQAHSFADCEAVVGPLMPVEQPDELAPLDAAALIDARNVSSFLNTRCGNFSIRASALEGPLFDDDARDFLWTGIEMGYRLYRRGLRVKHTSDAVSAGPPAAPDPQAASWFLDRHPDAAEEGGAALRALAAPPPSGTPRVADGGGRRLRVLTYRWHVAHQYELYKLAHDFHLITDLPTLVTNRWDLRQRPLPGNAQFIPKAAANPADYDLSIVHFDENVLRPGNSNGALGPYWGHAFRFLMAQAGLPKIAVCHGTPQFHGQFTPGYDKPDLLQVIEPARRELVECLKDTLVICNSYQAQAEWGFRRSKVIWHGFDPTEFPPGTYEKGILSPLGPAVSARPHYRGYDLYKQVFADFPAQYAPSTLFVPDPSPLYAGNQYAVAKYRNYVDEIRRYAVYFNPTLRSPMPRGRGEAMLCGLVTVSADNHDVDRFIRNGVNGFYARDPGELREHLLFLCRNPEAARRMGMEGRRTALKVFHVDRYLEAWRETIAQET